MSAISEFLENTLETCGGLGRFQWMIIGSVLGGKVAVTWSMLLMSFGGAIPDWSCQWGNKSAYIIKLNGTESACSPPSNYSEFTCLRRRYDESMSTVVSEWDLVCDKDWITQTITTIQMAGLLIGGLVAGQIADIFGRKPTYFLSMIMMFVFNLVAAFSVSWKMFAVLRFLIGIGCGFYLTVYFTFSAEFISGKWRPMLMAIPSWPIWAAIFGGLTCLLHDWTYLHIATAIATGPWLLTWWLIPESFRWLVSNGKVKEAEEIIKKMARLNKKPIPDLTNIKILTKSITTDGKKYTFLDVVKNKGLLKKTILLSVGWISCGYVYYAINFGVQQLSGSLCLNIFLLSTVEIPAQSATWFFNHYIGRKKTTMMFFLISSLTGTAVGIVQLIDTENKGQLINGFALTSKLGVAAGWSAIMLITTESYPTVVRNIGYGTQNSASRIGAMVAPQIVYVSQHTTGVMYFLCGATMLISAVCMLGIPETGHKSLKDTIDSGKKQNQSDFDKITKTSGEYNESFQSEQSSHL